MTTEELMVAIEEKRPEMIRLGQAMLRQAGLADDAEDFFQEAILRILSNTTEYNFDDGVGGLLQTTMTRLIFNRHEASRVRHQGNEEYTRIYHIDSQARMKQRERLKVDVELALAALEPQTSVIVRLIWMEGHPFRHVMRELRITDRTITTALEEALPILRRELARYDHRQRPASVEPQERVSVSQAPYKEGRDETDTTSPDGGHGQETEAAEMA